MFGKKEKWIIVLRVEYIFCRKEGKKCPVIFPVPRSQDNGLTGCQMKRKGHEGHPVSTGMTAS